MPSRQLIVHSAFTAVFVAIAVFAVWTANGTTAPWFSAAVSSQAYAASLVGAVVVAIALAAAAVSHVGRLEDARGGPVAGRRGHPGDGRGDQDDPAQRRGGRRAAHDPRHARAGRATRD